MPKVKNVQRVTLTITLDLPVGVQPDFVVERNDRVVKAVVKEKTARSRGRQLTESSLRVINKLRALEKGEHYTIPVKECSVATVRSICYNKLKKEGYNFKLRILKDAAGNPKSTTAILIHFEKEKIDS